MKPEAEKTAQNRKDRRRWRRIEEIRRQIARGTYDTPDKWDALLDRLLRDLRKP
jgi:anti-sigma28 factor (negative regulator of flagellin synthesis)